MRTPEKADLLLRREEQLHARVGPPLGDEPAHRSEHHRDRGLVVRAKDRPARVPDEPVLEHGLDRAVGRDRVEMGAQEDRRSLRRLARNTREDVAHRRADGGARVVLVPREADRLELRDHAIGDGPLLTRRARDRGQFEEETGDVAQRTASTATAPRARARSSAAATKPLKSGAGRVGRDLNSG